MGSRFFDFFCRSFAARIAGFKLLKLPACKLQSGGGNFRPAGAFSESLSRFVPVVGFYCGFKGVHIYFNRVCFEIDIFLDPFTIPGKFYAQRYLVGVLCEVLFLGKLAETEPCKVFQRYFGHPFGTETVLPVLRAVKVEQYRNIACTPPRAIAVLSTAVNSAIYPVLNPFASTLCAVCPCASALW